MRSKLFFPVLISIIMLIASFTFTSCDDFFEEVATTTTYYFYNNSSYSVTISGSGWAYGSTTIAPGKSDSGEFGNLSLSDLTYSPSNYVSVTQSGTSFYFRDKY